MSKKSTLIFIIAVTAAVITLSCGKVRKKEKNEVLGETSFIEVAIGGMTCTGCEEKIQASVSKLDGIKSIIASHTAANALIEYSPGLVDTLEIKNAIIETGYNVKKFYPGQAE